MWFTKHAIEKMDTLGIEKDEVIQTLNQGMKWKEKEREVWHAQMAGLEIVFIKDENDKTIITVYLAHVRK